MAEVLLTKKGYKELTERLEWLQSKGREEVAERIKVARGFGDLSENAEYDAAKNEQAEIEREIFEIESKLKNVKIITELNVDFCEVINGVEQEEQHYVVVGTNEVDLKTKRISDESPIGKALKDGAIGSVVEVKLANGKVKYLKINKKA